MPFDCLLITRPQTEAEELAAQLADLRLSVVIQPAHQFAAVQISAADLQALQHSAIAVSPPVLIFTSTRAVEFGLPQFPAELLSRCRLAAIGPATSVALRRGGLHSILQAGTGYTSEDLLKSLNELAVKPEQAWIIAASGGRQTLLQGLQQAGVDARIVFAYERLPVEVAGEAQDQLEQSGRILSVWTSANAMQQLAPEVSAGHFLRSSPRTATSLSPAAWLKVCAGEWLVVSPRLAEIARGFQPAAVHVSGAPGNEELARCVRKLCQQN
jgi:uroporphyrinogen-III synthase